MKFSTTGQEKDYLLIQVTEWGGLTVLLKWLEHFLIPSLKLIILGV